jgi:inorganic pyrophosphatase
LVTALLTEGEEITHSHEVESSLKKQLIYSTVILLPLFYMMAKWLFGNFIIFLSETDHHYKSPFDIFICISIGLVAGLIIGYFTEIMTSYTYKPVRELS